jgi:hypothetical protein
MNTVLQAIAASLFGNTRRGEWKRPSRRAGLQVETLESRDLLSFVGPPLTPAKPAGFSPASYSALTVTPYGKSTTGYNALASAFNRPMSASLAPAPKITSPYSGAAGGTLVFVDTSSNSKAAQPLSSNQSPLYASSNGANNYLGSYSTHQDYPGLDVSGPQQKSTAAALAGPRSSGLPLESQPRDSFSLPPWQVSLNLGPWSASYGSGGFQVNKGLVGFASNGDFSANKTWTIGNPVLGPNWRTTLSVESQPTVWTGPAWGPLSFQVGLNPLNLFAH